MHVRHPTKSSTRSLKLLLPKITSTRSQSKGAMLHQLPVVKESLSKKISHSANSSIVEVSPVGLGINLSSLLDKNTNSHGKNSNFLQSELANLVVNNVFDPTGDVTTKTSLCQSMAELALNYTDQKLWDSVLLVMEEIEANCITYQARPLVTGFYTAYTTILWELGEYSRCVDVGKKLLIDCVRAEDFQGMLFTYEKLGGAYSKTQELESSLRSYFLMLKVALKIRDYKKELTAYDKIGHQYFNLNQMDRGEYFHMRMVDGRLEKEDSTLRKMQFLKLSSDREEIIEEDLQDLAAVFFEPMAVDLKYRGFDDRQRKVIAFMDESKNPVRRVGNIKIYNSAQSEELGLDRLLQASYGRKPINCPLATLSHCSANRSIKIFDSVSGSDPKGTFRFLKFGKQLRPTTRKNIQLALQRYINALKDLKTRIVRTGIAPAGGLVPLASYLRSLS